MSIKSSQYYAIRFIFILVFCAFVVMLLASLEWISEQKIFPILIILWGLNGIFHGILLRKSIPLLWKDIPVWSAFSFQDKRSILGMIIPGLFMICFGGYLLF